MSKFVSYPKIGQFRNIVKDIQHTFGYTEDENGEWFFDHTKRLPTLEMVGHVKNHGCFDSNAIVTLANGDRIKISELAIGHSILSYNENSSMVEVDIVDDIIVSESEKEWIELEFIDCSTIICTTDHKFLTNDGWVEANQLTTSHNFITLK